MARKPGSAAELIKDQALLLAARMGRSLLALDDGGTPEALARANELLRHTKLAADAGRAVVAMEVAADKAIGAADGSAPAVSIPADDDSDEMDMNDPDSAAYALDQVDRMRDRLERRIAEILGGDEVKSAPAGLRAPRPVPDHSPTLGPGGAACATTT